MTRKCQVTGRKTASGQNRPFSMKATKRKFRPNLFWKKMWNPKNGRIERMLLSARGIKTLKKWSREAGKEEDPTNVSPEQKTTNEAKGRVKKEKLTPKQKKELAAKKEAEKKEAADSKVAEVMEGEVKKS